MKNFFAIIALALLAVTAQAQQDITSLMTSTTVAGSATNLQNGNGVIGWNIDQVAVLQASISQTNVAHATTLSNCVVRFDTSNNGTDWQTNAYSFSLAPAGVTNAAVAQSTLASTTIVRITNTIGGKWLRFGNTENVNTNRVTFSRFTLSFKEQ